MKETIPLSEPTIAFLNETVEDTLKNLNRVYASKLLPLVCILALLMVLGVAGNCAVVYVYRFKLRGTAKSIFILALAVVDLIVCSFVIPFEIYDLTHKFTFYDANLCKAFRFLEYTMVLAGGFLLVAISFERFYSICKTFATFTTKKAKIICATVAAISVTLAVPAPVLASSNEVHIPFYNVSGCECSMDSAGFRAEYYKKIYYCVLAGLFVCCVILFVIIYSLIGSILCSMKRGKLFKSISMDTLNSKTSSSKDRQTTELVDPTADTNSNMQVHGRRKLKSLTSTFVFFSVTVVFVLSFLPHIGTRLVQFLNIPIVQNMSKTDQDTLYNILIRSYLLSNVANPFIYSILNAKFRKELVQTFKICGDTSRNKPLRV